MLNCNPLLVSYGGDFEEMKKKMNGIINIINFDVIDT